MWSTPMRIYKLEQLRSILPLMSFDNEKGSQGQVGIVGGTVEDIGTLYQIAYTIMRIGADTVKIYCPSTFASSIQLQSPDIIVYPCLDKETTQFNVRDLIEGVTILLVGPNMAEDMAISQNTGVFIKICIRRRIPLIVDITSFGVMRVASFLLKDYERVIFTSNLIVPLIQETPLTPDMFEKNNCAFAYQGNRYVHISSKGMRTLPGNNNFTQFSLQNNIIILAGLTLYYYWALISKLHDPSYNASFMAYDLAIEANSKINTNSGLRICWKNLAEVIPEIIAERHDARLLIS